MRICASYLAPLFLVASVLSGCGGGSSTADSSGGGAGTTQSVGQFTLTASGPVTPHAFGSGSVLVYSMAGASFTNVTLNPLQSLGNTKIVAQSVDGQLYSMNPDGGNLQQITTNIGYGYNAFGSWAPSLAAIAIMGGVNGSGYIGARIKADGTGFTPLGYSSSTLSPIRWSRDGAKLLFDFSDSVSGHVQIGTRPYTGGAVTRISDGTSEDVSPSWSWDGKKIAFLRFTPGKAYNVGVMDANGSNVKILTTDGFYQNPTWFPDGNSVVVQRYDGAHQQLLRVAMNGVSDTLTTGTNDYMNPSVSPDGRYIAFTMRDSSSHLSLNRFSPSGGTPQLIADNFVYPEWSTYMPKKQMIGTSGIFGTASSGFVFTQVGEEVRSFISFVATTPTSTTVSNVTTGGTNIGLQISGNSITQLSYSNNIISTPTVVIPSGTTTSVHGVLLGLDTSDGHVTLMAPYVKAQAKGAEVHGEFLAVYDGKGTNLAPHGAKSVTLSPKGGLAAFVAK